MPSSGVCRYEYTDAGSRLRLHARGTAVGFYLKCGYRTVGAEFLEQGIPHIRMEKELGPRGSPTLR